MAAEQAGIDDLAVPSRVTAADVTTVPSSPAEEAPHGVDTAVPNVARIYDYLLGGKDNFAADRHAAGELIRLIPDAAGVARENRGFLQRAVKFLAESGIRQYIDIGTGLPTRGNVHQIAQQWQPGSHVLYVDNDTVVVTHAQALLADNRTVIAINRDLRQPQAILDHPALRALINFDEPVGVLLVAILHFISDADNAHGIVKQIMDEMPAGSYLVLSHGTADHVTPTVTQKAREIYDRTDSAAAPRTLSEITQFFNGCDLIEPGLVDGSSWRNDRTASEIGRGLFYAGVGIKR